MPSFAHFLRVGFLFGLALSYLAVVASCSTEVQYFRVAAELWCSVVFHVLVSHYLPFPSYPFQREL